MTVKIIQDRLDEYVCRTELEEENAIKEIVQEVCLAGLSRSGFFKEAAFQGGTCLRILYRLPRFSEDLDFVLKEPNSHFKLTRHLDHMKEELAIYGFNFEIQDRSQGAGPILKAFLKDESWGRILSFQHVRKLGSTVKKLQIKIEVDANPPLGSGYEDKILDFPLLFSVIAQDLPSLFAGKSHALLCRPYLKGRDWYDFLWYARKKIRPNMLLLGDALHQVGPWKAQKITVDEAWYRRTLSEKIRKIDWQEARRDIQRFLKPQDLASLDYWSTDFFLAQMEGLMSL